MARLVFTGLLKPAIRPSFDGFSEDDIRRLMAFKASERKDDPERLPGLHGPYEEMVLIKTGRLPDDYYEEGDSEPWGLRVRESRSNILWQVVSGLMDNYPEFGGAYMALALDHGLGREDYAHELQTLNKEWRNYIEHAGLINDHHHRSMGHIYRSVACPACSVLTSMASQNDAVIRLFKEMSTLKPTDRRHFLEEMGLLPLLNTMISDLPAMSHKP